MKIEKFYIYTSESFPYGFAATNRIIAYAKGFLYHGKDVEVVCLAKTESPERILNRRILGTYNGIKFRYLANSTVRSKTFIMRRVDNFIIYFKLFWHAVEYVNRKCAIIYYSPSTSNLLILVTIAKIKGAKIYKEDSEHPNMYILSNSNFISNMLFKYIHFRLFDGLLLMTKSLVNYYGSTKGLTKPILHVPMTVEVDRFKRINNDKCNSKEIIYTGMLNDEKDGTNLLIYAFSRISAVHPEYFLSIFGEAAIPGDDKRYADMAEQLQVGNKVHFHGRVDRDVITEKIVNAAILVLPRPDSFQAQNGFPTKLGEYLATGVPVIATAVGEIPDYLKDNESVFMAIPGDVDSLIEKFNLIINDYGKALEIAKNGQLVAEQNFSNLQQSADIIRFVEEAR